MTKKTIPTGPRAHWQRGYRHLLATWEEANSRYIWKSGDALLTAQLGGNGKERFKRREDAGGRGYRRVQHVLNALTRILPRTVEHYRRRLFDPRLFPFVADSVTLLGFGSGVTVFLMRAARDRTGPHVLKIYRESLGRRVESLQTMVRERRATYERLTAWYDGCSVLLPTQFLVLHGPLGARAAVACVQPYVDGPHTDIFEDLQERELLELLTTHPRLNAQFRLFVERSLQAVEREGACVDMVGRDNVVITGDGDQCRLVLLDNGFYDFARKAIRSPAALAELRNRLAYLQHVYAQLPAVHARRHMPGMEAACLRRA